MTPRDLFRSNRAITRGYNDTIGGEQMQAALDAAGREYDLTLSIAMTIEQAAANRWRKEGADAYRRILENLNAASVQPGLKPTSQLDPKA